jgi:hypothetical protein
VGEKVKFRGKCLDDVPFSAFLWESDFVSVCFTGRTDGFE